MNDIFGDSQSEASIRKSLRSKAIRTHDYFRATAALTFAAMKGLSLRAQVQIDMLRSVLEAEVVVVYASTVLNIEIRKQLRVLSVDDAIVERGIKVGFAVADSTEDCTYELLR